MAKTYGLADYRRGKIGDLLFRKVGDRNIVSEKGNYYPVNSAWLKKEEFRKYVQSLVAGSYDAVDVVDELPTNRNGDIELRNNTIYFVKSSTNDNNYKIYVYEDNTLKEVNVGGEGPAPENEIVTVDFDTLAVYNSSLLPHFTLDKVQSVFGNLLQGKQVELKITTTFDNTDFNVSYNIYNFASAKKTVSGILLHTMKAYFSAANYYQRNSFRDWCLNYTLPDTFEIVPADNDIFNDIYPVGSIALGTKPTIGTWEKIAENKTLWGSTDSLHQGTTLEAGLPNITGNISVGWGFNFSAIQNNGNGSLYNTGTQYSEHGINWNQSSRFMNNSNIYLDASRSSLIYGKSDTVQPPAYVVDIWIRVA